MSSAAELPISLPGAASRPAMSEVSLFRLYLLRALYLLFAVGLGTTVWPGVIHHDRPWELMGGVVQCVLAALGALSLLGLRYPLLMLPLVLWELTWKSIWLLVVATPLWVSGTMDKQTWAMASAILIVVIIPFVVPWSYVFRQYVMAKGDRWV
jgi:hypothetical protein